MKSKFQEKGQALIVIAIAAVVLFSFTALAIDGSMIFATKRQAQNAADAAALAAALAKTRAKDWQATGIASATTNKFSNDGVNVVTVLECTDPAANCSSVPAGADLSQYIYVKIIANVKTNFTNVFGISNVSQTVDAIARAVPGFVDKIAYGNAVVALNKTDCKAFWGNGNGNMKTIGGGVFVNSTSNCGLTLSGGPTLNTPSVTVAGPASNPAIAGANYNAPQLPPMVMPNPSCGSVNATIINGDTMTPGNWTGTFPGNGVKYLQGGVYCVNGKFSMNGNDTLTGFDVVIRMDSGDIAWNGNGSIKLTAPTEGPFKGLLIFIPPTNPATVKINGTNDQQLTGTILAPTSDIELLGTAGTNGFNSQIIGYNVKFGGTFDGTIEYNEQLNFPIQYAPQIEVTQ